MSKLALQDLDPTIIASTTYVDTFTPEVKYYAPAGAPFEAEGMGWNTTWLWATVRTAAGKEYMIVRSYTSDVTGNFAVLEYADNLWGETGIRVAPVNELASLYWGELRWYTHDDHVEVVGNNKFMPPLRAEFRPGRFHLVEADFCELEFHPVRAGRIKITVPGPPEPVGYAGEPCTVTGTVEGSEIVSGYGNQERLCGVLGSSWYRGKIFNDLQQMWLGWGTAELGGPREFGLIFFGQGEFCAAYHVVEGEGDPITVNELDFCDIEWQERDGLVRPASFKFGFAGREFEGHHTGSLEIPGADLDRHWVGGEVRQTNREGAGVCRSMTEVLNSLRVE